MSIVLWENPVLSTVCSSVEENEFGPELEKFGQDLLDTMNSKSGLGLAAPQVGVTKRMFAMLLGYDTDKEQRIVVVNPILSLGGTTVAGREGCLSLPNVFEQVMRAKWVTMQYRDPQGGSHEVVIEDMDARIAQHEFDHLNGIMFFNYTDKREGERDNNGRPYGARMSKQVSKNVLRLWEKEKKSRGL